MSDCSAKQALGCSQLQAQGVSCISSALHSFRHRVCPASGLLFTALSTGFLPLQVWHNVCPASGLPFTDFGAGVPHESGR